MTAATIQAAGLLADAWHEAHKATYRLGHHYGYTAGYTAGFDACETVWNRIIGAIGQTMRAPDHDELVRRRQPPTEPCGQPSCRPTPSCSQCVYIENRARNGEWKGTDR